MINYESSEALIGHEVSESHDVEFNVLRRIH